MADVNPNECYSDYLQRPTPSSVPDPMAPTVDPWELLRTALEFIDVGASKNVSSLEVKRRVEYQRRCLKQHDAERKSDAK